MKPSDIITCVTCGRSRLRSVKTCRHCKNVFRTLMQDCEKQSNPVEKTQKRKSSTEIKERGRIHKRDRMSQTERRWAQMHPHHVYESITLRMSNGHKYTPDFVDWANMLLIEVKDGRHKLGSFQRAMLAYDQCRKEFTRFHFAWAVWNGTEFDVHHD